MSTRTLVSLSIVMGLSVTGCPEKQAETSAEPAAEEKTEDKPVAAEVEKADEAAGAKDEGADKPKEDGEKEEEGGW